jgi:hypothetical protein
VQNVAEGDARNTLQPSVNWKKKIKVVSLKDSDDRVTLRINGFLDLVHRPGFKIQENNVSETGTVSVLR